MYLLSLDNNSETSAGLSESHESVSDDDGVPNSEEEEVILVAADMQPKSKQSV